MSISKETAMRLNDINNRHLSAETKFKDDINELFPVGSVLDVQKGNSVFQAKITQKFAYDRFLAVNLSTGVERKIYLCDIVDNNGIWKRFPKNARLIDLM